MPRVGLENLMRLLKAGKMIQEKRSQLCKINKKNKTKARTPHIPLPDAVTREIITALAVICAQNQ